MIPELGKALMVFGVVLLVLGVVLQYGISSSWLSWIGKLPGDIEISFSRFRLLLPLGSCLVVSLVLTVLLQLFTRSR